MTKNIVYCLWIEWEIFRYADKINKLSEKKRQYVSSDNQPIRAAKRMLILPHGTRKDNIRSVILDWRRRPSGHSSEWERSAGLSREGRDPLVTQADLSAPRVYSPAAAQLHKNGPRQRRKICANSLWLYSNDIQASPSKNKNINIIFIYLRVFRCLSCGQYTTSCSCRKLACFKILQNLWFAIVSAEVVHFWFLLSYSFSFRDWQNS